MKNNLTYEEIWEKVSELYEKRDIDRRIMLTQTCLEKGTFYVYSDELSILCDNEDCVTCRIIEDSFKSSFLNE